MRNLIASSLRRLRSDAYLFFLLRRLRGNEYLQITWGRRTFRTSFWTLCVCYLVIGVTDLWGFQISHVGIAERCAMGGRRSEHILIVNRPVVIQHHRTGSQLRDGFRGYLADSRVK